MAHWLGDKTLIQSVWNRLVSERTSTQICSNMLQRAKSLEQGLKVNGSPMLDTSVELHVHSWSQNWALSPQVTEATVPAVGSHYFPTACSYLPSCTASPFGCTKLHCLYYFCITFIIVIHLNFLKFHAKYYWTSFTDWLQCEYDTEKYHHIQCLRPKNVAKQCAQEQSQ